MNDKAKEAAKKDADYIKSLDAFDKRFIKPTLIFNEKHRESPKTDELEELKRKARKAAKKAMERFFKERAQEREMPKDEIETPEFPLNAYNSLNKSIK